jgi:predicted site-specific integrase-resolvase
MPKRNVKPPPRPGPSEPRVVSNEVAALRLGVSVRTVQRWRRSGLLTTVVINGRSRVLASSIASAVERGTH